MTKTKDLKMRKEYLRVNLNLDHAAAIKHATTLKTFWATLPPSVDGDELHVRWTLVLDYLDDVAVKLRAVNTLCNDPAVVVDANCAMLEEGQCLVFEVLTNLKQLIKHVKRRDSVWVYLFSPWRWWAGR